MLWNKLAGTMFLAGLAGFGATAGAGTTKILTFGDSGRGTPDQMEVARSMARVCRNQGCDFALMLFGYE